jgi:hypothetical protein
VCDKTRINAHEWNHGCRCELCGEVRDEMHRWDGCKCTVCSKTRDWGHKWNGCTCSACSETRDQAHRWDGCTCSLCFKTRDEAHSWDGCRCSICAKTRDEAHNWNGCVCSMCRKKRSKGRTYIVGERGWDGCTGHDWSRHPRRFVESTFCREEPSSTRRGLWIQDKAIGQTDTLTRQVCILRREKAKVQMRLGHSSRPSPTIALRP